MGESKNHCFRFNFTDKLLKAFFKGSSVTSDNSLIAIRELDEQLGLTAMAQEYLVDTRQGRNIQHKLVELLRQSVYSHLAGYEDVYDADRLRNNPAFRAVLSERALEKSAGSECTLGRFQKEILTQRGNLEKMNKMLMKWIKKVDARRGVKGIVLDLDSSTSPVYGEQEGASYHSCFGRKSYHPLFCFNQYGDCLKVKLRPGNVHRAQGVIKFVEPILKYYVAKGIKTKLRADAVLAGPRLYNLCEELGVEYAISIKENSRLAEGVVELTKKTEGKNREKVIILYKDFLYQAESWNRPRRIVAKIEHHPAEIFPRVGFIITDLKWRDKKVVKFYSKRGTYEQWIKEGKYALNRTKLSCQKFTENEARLKLFMMAYNLGNFLRTLALPEGIKH